MSATVLRMSLSEEQGQAQSLGALFGLSWSLSGLSWGPLGAVLALGSPSWAVLGRLGALLGRLKIDVKIYQKIDAFQD